ncbi:MAG: response regulator receiver protein [Bacteroidetes bacterium B1(2017)]|nr:MAG: response regulator receiver protein [Bacteroidetes bacterium B1(2017)]
MESASGKDRVAFVSADADSIVEFSHSFKEEFEVFHFDNIFQFIQWTNLNEPVKLIVTYSDLLGANGITLRKNCKNVPKTANVPFVLIVDRITDASRNIALLEQFSDIFERPVKHDEFMTRAKYLIDNPPRYHKSIVNNQSIFPKYSIPFAKRIFDVVFASLALLFLLPFFLIFALIIMLESKGPVFYAAKRVGSGYTLFDFYKFRSMRQGADAMLKNLKHLNQYGATGAPETLDDFKTFVCEECRISNSPCKSKLYMDGDMICEKVFADYKRIKDGSKFIKIENDPRITRFGKIMRNTSIDELPQLFNVLKGDMSIVGNRPLPLYEAEKLTTDQFALRFMAPAGITGLWQVTKRGKGGPMSEEERMELDNEYAKNYSFWNDIGIILKTIPALFQKENV